MDGRVVLSKWQDLKSQKPLLGNEKSKELLGKVEKIFTATTMDHQGLKEVISVLGSYCVEEKVRRKMMFWLHPDKTKNLPEELKKYAKEVLLLLVDEKKSPLRKNISSAFQEIFANFPTEVELYEYSLTNQGFPEEFFKKNEQLYEEEKKMVLERMEKGRQIKEINDFFGINTDNATTFFKMISKTKKEINDFFNEKNISLESRSLYLHHHEEQINKARNINDGYDYPSFSEDFSEEYNFFMNLDPEINKEINDFFGGELYKNYQMNMELLGKKTSFEIISFFGIILNSYRDKFPQFTFLCNKRKELDKNLKIIEFINLYGGLGYELEYRNFNPNDYSLYSNLGIDSILEFCQTILVLERREFMQKVFDKRGRALLENFLGGNVDIKSCDSYKMRSIEELQKFCEENFLSVKLTNEILWYKEASDLLKIKEEKEEKEEIEKKHLEAELLIQQHRSDELGIFKDKTIQQLYLSRFYKQVEKLKELTELDLSNRWNLEEATDFMNEMNEIYNGSTAPEKCIPKLINTERKDLAEKLEDFLYYKKKIEEELKKQKNENFYDNLISKPIGTFKKLTIDDYYRKFH